MKRALVAALGAAVAAAGAAAAPDESPAEPPVRDCATRVESGRAPLPFRGTDGVVAGPVSFWSLQRAAAGLGPRRPDGTWFVKTAVSVLAGGAVTVSIPERFALRIALVYARPPRASSSVRFVPCAPSTRAFSYAGRVGTVTGFNGGFVVSRLGCYRLEIRRGQRKQHVRVAFGRPCR